MLNTPPKLYELCLDVAVADSVSVCKFCQKEFRSLPNNVLFDFYYKASCFLYNGLFHWVVEKCRKIYWCFFK